MTQRLLQLIFVLALLLLKSTLALAAPVEHDLLLRVDPHSGHLHGHDRIQLSTVTKGPLQFTLGEGLKVESVTVDGTALRFAQEGEQLLVTLPQDTLRLELRYSGRLDRAEPPQLRPEGSWLPGEFAWYPRLDESDRLVLTVLAPRGQRPVLTGELLHEHLDEDGVRASFRAHVGEPPSLFIGPYIVEERMHRGLRLRTYFHEEARPLAPAYLDDVARHIDRYASIIGPYPYQGFDVVSAPHPVGLGYPGLTYVARRILHRPFMRERSLPHEILHVWWGNAVRVAAEGGNWAEGLTTYMSDYRLSAAAERERMRHEWLRDHAALPAAEDHALSRFLGKVHARDEVVGYGKGAFVFHMLEQRIGTRAFEGGLARFFAAHHGKAASWEDLRQAFENASGEQLERFFRQWVEQAGTAELVLEDVAFHDAGVRFTLAQREPPYELRVPLAIETERGRETHVVVLAEAVRTVEIETLGRPMALHIDPAHDLFRRLAAGEVVPTLRDLRLLPEAQMVLVNVPDEAAGTARELSRRLLRSAGIPVPTDGWVRERPALVIGFGASQAVAAALGLLPPPELSAQGSAFVWAARGVAAPTVVVTVRDRAALEALLRPLPHYGGDSWLLFDGARLLERGLWPPTTSHSLSVHR